jgi:hypothetical protein
MFRIERGRTLSVLLLALVVCALAAVPVAADEIHYEGEPTDPEKMLYFDVRSDELATSGVSLTPPADAAEYDSWLEALLNLLRALGLIPAGDSTP